jgi:serine/threonine protein kinase/HEAT repeat protein
VICPTCHNEAGVSEVCGVCGRPLFLAAGEVLSARYEILSLLGSGGMGTVYRAHDRILEETVALKVLRLDLARSAGMARRFRSEIKLARKVSHRNVCRIYDYGEDGQHVYISMEFVDGVDLRSKVRGRGLPAEEGFEVAIQLTKGLQAVHDVGIIHRDLKSSNVMVDSKGLVRLMDFGIAKRWISDGQVTGTMVGQIMGTPEYMSPEQARGHPVDFRGDIYSLGVVLFEVFTGQVPFEGRTKVETLFMQLEEAPPLTGPRAKRLPRALVPILKRALAKDPADRYASARGMTEALRLARGGPDLEPRVRPAFFRPQRRPPAPPLPAPASSAPSEPGSQAEAEPTSVLEHLLDELEADAPPAGHPTADPGVQQKVRDLGEDLSHPDVRRRWRAAIALWELGGAAGEAEDALTTALSDEAPIVVNAAAQALARIRGESAPRPDARPTTGIIEVPLLIEALQHHDVRVREWAAVALRDLGTAAEEAVAPLLAVLRDTASGIRDWAALALGSVSTDVTDVLPELVKALQDPSMFLRAAAATSLGSLGSRARPAVPQLTEALQDENGGVRGRAAVALGRMGAVARDAVPRLLRLLEDREVSVADAAALALEKIIGRPEPTAEFAPVAPRTAAAAAPVPDAVVPPPAPPDAAVPPPAAPDAAVPPPAPPDAAVPPPAVPDAADVPPTVDLAALAAAALQAPRPAPGNGVPRVRDLVAGLMDGDAAVRWRAAVALGEMGPAAEEAVRALVEAMEDAEDSVRWEAAKALGRIGPAARAAVPALAAALAEDDDVLRNAAATALGMLGADAQKAVPALIRSLRGSSDAAPDAAMETLVKLGRSSVPALIEALNEDDPQIRSRAAQALTRVAGSS